MLFLPALLSVGAVLCVLLLAFRRELSWKRLSVEVAPPPLDRPLAILCAAAWHSCWRFPARIQPCVDRNGGAALLLVLSRQPPRRCSRRWMARCCSSSRPSSWSRTAWRRPDRERIHTAIAPFLGHDATQQTVRFGFFTVAACQLVNVPFVLLAAHWVPKLADPHLGWLSLALFSTLAGNLTPVASVATSSSSNWLATTEKSHF